jgi:hypothetical protein
MVEYRSSVCSTLVALSVRLGLLPTFAPPIGCHNHDAKLRAPQQLQTVQFGRRAAVDQPISKLHQLQKAKEQFFIEITIWKS